MSRRNEADQKYTLTYDLRFKIMKNKYNMYTLMQSYKGPKSKYYDYAFVLPCFFYVEAAIQELQNETVQFEKKKTCSFIKYPSKAATI